MIIIISATSLSKVNKANKKIYI